MDPLVDVFVPGDPRPQGSKRIGRVGGTGRPIVLDDAPGLRAWRDTITAHARICRECFDGPVAVALAFTIRAPERHRRDLPTVRPDLDKLARAVLDAITDAGLWHDDAQVTRLAATKRYGPRPGVHIRIEPDLTGDHA